MLPRFAALAALFLLSSGANGCELGAIMSSALSCSATGTYFNYTKYESYIMTLINDASAMGVDEENIGQFFAKHSFASMAEVFGEVEPAIVWMMDSFYKEHLKDRTEDTFIRPMFGDMSKMEAVLNTSLQSHCNMLNELIGCINTQLMDRCSKKADAALMKTLFMDPLQGVFCSGTTVKTASYKWLRDRSAGLTSAFSCVTDRDPTKKNLTIRDFEKDPVIASFDFGYLMRECNAEAVGPAFEQWVQDTKLDKMFENFDIATFNIFDIVNMNIPKKAMRVLRPMADCFIQKLMPFAEDLCPSVTAVDEVKKLMEVFRFFAPVFTDDQDMVKDMMINPRPKPDLGSRNRISLAMIGGFHIFNFNTKEWVDTCPPTGDSTLLFAVNGFTVQAIPGPGIYVVSKIGDKEYKMIFKDGALFLQKEDESYATAPMELGALVNLTKEIGLYDPVFQYVVTDAKTYFTIPLVYTGTIATFSKPAGNDWALFVRSGKGLFDLAHGTLVKGCSGMSAKTNVSREAANAAQCVEDCKDTGALMDPCKYDCLMNMKTMAAQLTAFKTFDFLASKEDKEYARRAVNRDPGATYGPCTLQGFTTNIGSSCLAGPFILGLLPDFNKLSNNVNELMAGIAVYEPAILMAAIGIAKGYSVQVSPTARTMLGVAMTETDYQTFISKVHFTSVVTKHCKVAKVLGRCIERKMPDFCPKTGAEAATIFSKIKNRYCTGLDTDTPAIKQAVVDEMMAATTDLIPELSCFMKAGFFDIAKLTLLYAAMNERCGLTDLFGEVMKLISAAEGWEMLTVIENLIRNARNPIRCMVKVVSDHCANVDMSALVDRLIIHINRVTAGVFTDTINKEYFIKTKPVNVGSKKRVTMMAVGDPHLRAMGETTYTVCDKAGENIYFYNDDTMIVELKAYHSLANETSGSTATMITNVTLRIWEPNVAYSSPEKVKYVASSGDSELPGAFVDGTTDVVIGNLSVFVKRRNSKVVVIQNTNTGTFIIVNRLKPMSFLNLLMRTAESYAEDGRGLFISGCGADSKNITELNAEVAAAVTTNTRRKRAVSFDQCTAACTAVSADLQQECIYDCGILQDTTVGEAHTGAVEAEQEAEAEDTNILQWLPDLDVVDGGTTMSSATSVFVSCTLFVLTALVLLM